MTTDLEAPSQYRQNCFEEHGEHCETCGTTENLVAHHIDGDRSNNALDNLLPVCRSCHAKIHHGSPGYEQWYKQLDESAQRGTDGPTLADRSTVTMYLPPDLVAEADLIFQELRLDYQREHGEKLEKNADFYPAVLEAAFSERTVRDVLEIEE